LQSYERQRDFVRSHVKELEPKRKLTSSKKARTFTREYYLDLDTGQRVCKEFFLSTLDIGKKVIDISLQQKRRPLENITDQRGKHTPANRTDDHILETIHTHINSSPRVGAHYAQKDTTKEFLEPNLNLTNTRCRGRSRWVPLNPPRVPCVRLLSISQKDIG
jgi:hypothetical protein